jgi:hypothetical protein
MDLRSDILERDEFLLAIQQVVALLHEAGIREVIVSYGWDCDCPDERRYQDNTMASDELWTFIKESEAVGYYRAGENDLHVRDGDGRIEILFCHESDIHLNTDEPALYEMLRRRTRWL